MSRIKPTLPGAATVIEEKQKAIRRSFDLPPYGRTPYAILFDNNPQLLKCFEILKATNMLPTAEELSDGAALENSAWQTLFASQNNSDDDAENDSDAVFTVFLDLMNRSYFPSLTELNTNFPRDPEINSWQHIWHRMSSENEKGLACFEKLLAQRIFPTPDILNQSRDGKNTWWWLARTEKGQQLFLKLLRNDIRPTAEALNTCANGDDDEENIGLNTWRSLIKKLGTDLICRDIVFTLFSYGIFPSREALTLFPKNRKKNTWYLLSNSSYGHRVFIDLLLNGVFPSMETMMACVESGPDQGLNAWWWIMNYLTDRENDYAPLILQHLLNKDIPPTTKALEAKRSSSGQNEENAWQLLGGNSETFFDELLRRGIIPNSTMGLHSALQKLVRDYAKQYPTADYSVIKTLVNKQYGSTYLPALFAIVLGNRLNPPDFKAIKFPSPDICLYDIAQYMLKPSQFTLLYSLYHCKEDERDTVNQDFLFRAWRFFFLTQLSDYINGKNEIQIRKHVDRARSFLKGILQPEQDPIAIFKMLWLQYYLLTCWQRGDYVHPYAEKREEYQKGTKNKDARHDHFAGIIRDGIRLFPVSLTIGQPLKTLPRLTYAHPVTEKPKSSCSVS